jgi:glutathione-regulated potassium-efflux system ancillary protein KefG
MNNVLILFAHPRFEKSKTNRALLKDIEKLKNVMLHDLYEEYPDFNIDIEHEKQLLLAHDIIVWHHPLYLYGAPAMLKQWMDLVLEHGWAHGKNGNNLKDKIIFNTLTAGGTKEAYTEKGLNRFSIREFLLPFAQTAALCNMVYLPPFVVHGTYLLSTEDLSDYAHLYHTLLETLVKEKYDVKHIRRFEYLNNWLLKKTEKQNP